MALSKRQTQEWWDEWRAGDKRRYTVGHPAWLERSQDSVAKKGYRLDTPDLPEVNTNFCITRHAKLRLAQRNLSSEEVISVLLYGEAWHKAGVVIIHLRRKDIPGYAQNDQRWQQLIGTTVVIHTQSERIILTAYRNRRFGLQHIKHKPDIAAPLQNRSRAS